MSDLVENPEDWFSQMAVVAGSEILDSVQKMPNG